MPLVAVKSVPATAVPLDVPYMTPTAPFEPPTRLTVTVNAPAPWAIAKLDAESCVLPAGAAASPLMVTLVMPGLLMVAPGLGLDSATVNALLPEKGAAFKMPTENPFGVASPSAH